MLDLPHAFDFEGRRVAWGRIGDGPPLVLVHGTPFSSQVWRRVAPLLARGRAVHYFDLLGYGASDRGPGDVSLGIQNRVLAAILAHWGLDRPEVLARDFGGAAALRAHYLGGVAYDRLTLVDPVALAPWGSPFVAHVRRHETAFAGLPAYARAALLDAHLQGASHRGLDAKALDAYRGPWLGEVGQPAFYRQIAQMDQAFTDEVEPLYATLPFPTTLLWGAEDAWTPLSQGCRLADLPRLPLRVVPGVGHLVQDDAPEAIVAALLDPSS